MYRAVPCHDGELLLGLIKQISFPVDDANVLRTVIIYVFIWFPGKRFHVFSGGQTFRYIRSTFAVVAVFQR